MRQWNPTLVNLVDFMLNFKMSRWKPVSDCHQKFDFGSFDWKSLSIRTCFRPKTNSVAKNCPLPPGLAKGRNWILLGWIKKREPLLLNSVQPVTTHWSFAWSSSARLDLLYPKVWSGKFWLNTISAMSNAFFGYTHVIFWFDVKMLWTSFVIFPQNSKWVFFSCWAGSCSKICQFKRFLRLVCQQSSN